MEPTRQTTLWSVWKVRDRDKIREKSAQKMLVGYTYLAGHSASLLVWSKILVLAWGQGVFLHDKMGNYYDKL